MSADPKAAILETEDFHRRVFREQCQRDERLRELVQPAPQYIERLSEREAVEFYGYGSDAI